MHPRVHVHVLRPPASAATLLGSERIVRKKWRAAKGAVGSSASAPFSVAGDTEAPAAAVESVPAKTERLRRILERWRHSEPSEARCGDARSLGPQAATVRATCSGFIAAVTVGEKSLLVSSISSRISTEVDSQIAACLLSEGEHLETDTEDYQSAVDQIHSWYDHDLAAMSAGVGGSRSRVRKRLLSRIDAAIERAPPHVRISRSRIADRARKIATGEHGAALEADLDLLANSPVPDHEWLTAVASLESRSTEERDSDPATLTIHAVLLLREAR
jgi:hypothetical protein